jgi:hypothetical protein
MNCQPNREAYEWRGFVGKARLADAPEDLEDVVEVVKMFIRPLAVSLAQKRPFHSVWTAPGPWR